MMAKKFNDLTKDFTDEQRKLIEAEKSVILNSINLQDLRKALKLTQIELAAVLNVSQTAVSKIESNSDMYIGTLSRFLEAMGGELKIVAAFADREVEISQFKDIALSDITITD
ncbi:MAG: helix-turn-helix transcriptional regulator [Candidatus Marinimicrobia bacterium]|nr:helix-turn-helix transcriptional regulator [Candidatus Neomarinimicrobiota bacterium]